MTDDPRTVTPATDPEPPEGTVIARGNTALIRHASGSWLVCDAPLLWHEAIPATWDVLRWGWNTPGTAEDVAHADARPANVADDTQGPQSGTQGRDTDARLTKIEHAIDHLDMWTADADARLDKFERRLDALTCITDITDTSDSESVSEAFGPDATLSPAPKDHQRTLGTGTVMSEAPGTITIALDEGTPTVDWTYRRVRILDNPEGTDDE